jgi:hypothetical protein
MVSERADDIQDSTARVNLMAASAILAGLRLEDDTIFRLVRRDIMRESTVYQTDLPLTIGSKSNGARYPLQFQYSLMKKVF